MVTTEIFESLKELQTILVQKYELEKKVADAPKQLRNQEELLAKTQKEFIELKSQYDVLDEKINKIKSDLNDAISEREEGERVLQTVKHTVNMKLLKNRFQKLS